MLIQHLCEGIIVSTWYMWAFHTQSTNSYPLPCYRWKWGPEGLSNLSRMTQVLQSASNPISPHITQTPLATENFLSSQWIGKFLLKQLPTSFCSVIYWVLRWCPKQETNKPPALWALSSISRCVTKEHTGAVLEVGEKMLKCRVIWGAHGDVLTCIFNS